MAELSLLTYNVLYNNAYNEIETLINRHHPDLVCLQEIDTNENNLSQLEKHGYRLADYSNSFIKFGQIFGVATFYNPDHLKFTKSITLELPRSIYEIIILGIRLLRGGNKPRTVLKTDFRLKNGQKITIYNTHLAVFETNGARVKQMKKIFEFIDANKKLPVIITGDFNYYPYRRRQLESIMEKHQLSEATNNLTYTMQLSADGKKEKYNLLQKIFSRILFKLYTDRFKLDYIFYKNLTVRETRRVNFQFSDHFPILSIFAA